MIELAGAPSITPVERWTLCSSAHRAVDELGGVGISRPEYEPTDWVAAPARATVIAALVGAGRFADIERSTNLRDLVDADEFAVPWWYRTTFATNRNGWTTIRFDGVLHKADVFMNGSAVASADEVAGAYAAYSFDVSDLVREGVNAIALRVHPGDPIADLTINWWDWNQAPPGHDLGIWRDVVVERTGPIRLETPSISSAVDDDARSAELTIAVDLANLDVAPVRCEVAVNVSGHGIDTTACRQIELGAGESGTVVFAPRDHAALVIDRPALWSPIGEGTPNRYRLDVAASVGDIASARRSIEFGVRTVRSVLEPGGGRRFIVNNKPIEIIGGGWSPDLFLRSDPDRIAAELSYVADLGHNTIRLEGKFENPEFFEMTDAAGILVLAGWECCSRWEEKGPQGSPWTEHDFRVAESSIETAAKLLRHHPSVIGFLIGSDFAPPPRTAELYVEALGRCRWDLPVVSAATAEPTDAAGPSGMKMTGPYSWVPPSYWYARAPEHGGAIGFNSETSAGATIPRLSSLRRFLGETELEALWSDAHAKQFHAGPPSEFDNLSIFHEALAARYGTPRDLVDFVKKAQLANYEASRAQFEAYRARAYAAEPATGVIYWLLNAAWPSLNWQLYDWYLDPGGAYYGAKKGCERLHAFYAYDEGTIAIANHSRDPVAARLRMQVRDIDGREIESADFSVDSLAGRTVRTVATPAQRSITSPTYFLSLGLVSEHEPNAISRNTYWLSTIPDVLDWGATTWQYTPTSSYADLRGLERLAPATLSAEILDVGEQGGFVTVRLLVENPGGVDVPAVGVHVAFSFDEGAGKFVPVYWSDNDVTLFAGESQVFGGRCRSRRRDIVGVEIDAFNFSEPIRLSL